MNQKQSAHFLGGNARTDTCMRKCLVNSCFKKFGQLLDEIKFFKKFFHAPMQTFLVNSLRATCGAGGKNF